MATRRGEDEVPRREREEIEPDYARGQQPEGGRTVGSDFARGQRQEEMDPHEGDFAEGQDESAQHVEAVDHGDFARGQRQEPDRP